MLGDNVVMSPEQLVEKVRDDLRHGRIKPADISVRRVADWLKKSTMVVYHHFGSLDGMLFAVGQSGMRLLGERLVGRNLAEVAEEFVRFGIEAPSLYYVMFEHHYDWAALRKAGALKPDMPGRHLFVHLVKELGSDRDARIFIAGLHGLVSLALSGRANVGALQMTDEAAAIDAARELVRKLTREKHDSRRTHPAERRSTEKSSRQVGDVGAARRKRRRAQ